MQEKTNRCNLRKKSWCDQQPKGGETRRGNPRCLSSSMLDCKRSNNNNNNREPAKRRALKRSISLSCSAFVGQTVDIIIRRILAAL